MADMVRPQIAMLGVAMDVALLVILLMGRRREVKCWKLVPESGQPVAVAATRSVVAELKDVVRLH